MSYAIDTMQSALILRDFEALSRHIRTRNRVKELGWTNNFGSGDSTVPSRNRTYNPNSRKY
jgi:hypothetical protein